jgi:hypothetical protein
MVPTSGGESQSATPTTDDELSIVPQEDVIGRIFARRDGDGTPFSTISSVALTLLGTGIRPHRLGLAPQPPATKLFVMRQSTGAGQYCASHQFGIIEHGDVTDVGQALYRRLRNAFVLALRTGGKQCLLLPPRDGNRAR